MLDFKDVIARLEARLAAYDYQQVDQDHPLAAVLVALADVDGEPSLLLTQRSEHLRIHPGEIAFPGGKQDPEDSNLLATALREADEEVALPSRLFNPVGVLDERVTRSHLRVTPCVGYLSELPELCPNPNEIAEVFTVPLSFFLCSENLIWDYVVYRGEPRYVAYFQYQDYRIWGMTAMVIVNMVNVLFDAGFAPPELEVK